MAPATLSEGYSFQVEMEGGKTISVQVPPGGVEEGQKFMVPLSEQDSSSVKFGMPRIQVPVGEWRDGLCNCFKYGLCHYHLWTSCCCVLSTFLYIYIYICLACCCIITQSVLFTHTHSIFGSRVWASHFPFAAHMDGSSWSFHCRNYGSLLDSLLHCGGLLDSLPSVGNDG